MRYSPFRDLRTSRLRLRQVRMADLEACHRLCGNENVTRYMLFLPHKNREETAASIQKWRDRYDAGCCYHWAIALADTDELIGIIDLLRFDEASGTASFAYMLREDVWGLGYGTEALRRVLDFGFREMELECIRADHMADNGASGAVMRKAGMTYQEIVPEKYEKNGRAYDAVVYAVTRQQWMK